MEMRGYTRPLFAGDDPSTDVEALQSIGVVNVTLEASHRSRVHRSMLIAELNAGDVLVVTSLERLDSHLPNLIRVLLDMHDRGVQLRCDAADVDDVGSLLRALVEFQHRLVSRATRAGVVGKPSGRPRALDETGVAMAVELLRAGRTVSRIAQILGVGETAVRTALRDADAHGGRVAP